MLYNEVLFSVKEKLDSGIPFDSLKFLWTPCRIFLLQDTVCFGGILSALISIFGKSTCYFS